MTATIFPCGCDFVMAVFDPVPNAAAWTANGLSIDQITMPNGAKSDACVRAKSKIGSGEQATDSFSSLCFDGEGRLESYGSPRYSMEFSDYRGFDGRQVPCRLVDHPEPGTELVGQVVQLEAEPKAMSADLFAPLAADQDRFRSIQVSSKQMEELSADAAPIQWPPVHSGNVRGRLAMYISVDTEGRVREARPLNSDNAGLEDSARDQVRQWKMKPATDSSGKRVQVDGGLGFAFATVIGDPLPQLNDVEVRGLATRVVEPKWIPGSVQSGQVIEVDVSVNEEGKLTGEVYTKVPNAAQGAVMNAIGQWTFRPLIRGGKPQYFHGTVQFTVK